MIADTGDSQLKAHFLRLVLTNSTSHFLPVFVQLVTKLIYTKI